MPVTVTQLIPSIFDNSPVPNQAYSAFIDNDNVHGWIWGYSSSKFARVTLNTNTLIFNGNINGNDGSLPITNGQGAVTFVQDDNSHYYCIAQDSLNGNNATLWKFHLGSGPGGSFLSGNSIDDAKLDISSQVIHTFVTGYAYGKSGGVRYLVLTSTNLSNGSTGVLAVNLDTMSLIGTSAYVHASGSNQNPGQCFMDKNGVFWIILQNPTGSAGGGTDFVSWNPTDGTSGGHINVNVTNVSLSVLPLDIHSTSPNGTTILATYSPSNHAVIVVNQTRTDDLALTGDLIGISLTTFTQVALHSDDGQFAFNGGFQFADTDSDIDGQFTAFQQGVQPDTTLLIQGNPSPDTGQQGGIANIINPVNFSLVKTLNLASLVQGAGFSIIQTNGITNPLASCRYSSTANGILCVFGNARLFPQTNNGGAAFWLNGINPVTNTLITITGNFQDLEGNPIANGFLLIRIESDAKTPAGQLCSKIPIKTLLDSNGSIISLALFSNQSLNTGIGFNQYEAKAYTHAGQLVWRTTFSVPNTNPTFDLGTIVPNQF